MSRRRKNRISGQFTARLVEMLESPAYRELSLSAHRVLGRLEVEIAHHGGTDNGRLPVTYDNFEAYGIHRHAISAAIRECVALGFVEITEQGRAGNAEFRRPTMFRLTYVYTDRSCPPTHDWRKVGNEKEASELARQARNVNRNPVVVSAKSQCGNRHRKPEIHSAETVTTGVSAETGTTSISAGRDAA